MNIGDKLTMVILPHVEWADDFKVMEQVIEVVEPFWPRTTEGAWDKVDSGEQFFFKPVPRQANTEYNDNEGGDILEKIPDEPGCWRFCWGDHCIGEVFLTSAASLAEMPIGEQALFEETLTRYQRDVDEFFEEN